MNNIFENNTFNTSKFWEQLTSGNQPAKEMCTSKCAILTIAYVNSTVTEIENH